MKIQVHSLAIALAIAGPLTVAATAKSSAAPINGMSIKAAAPAPDRRALSGESGLSLRFVLELSHLLLLRISHHLLLLLRVSQLSDLFTILERLRLVVTPGTGGGGRLPSSRR